MISLERLEFGEELICLQYTKKNGLLLTVSSLKSALRALRVIWEICSCLQVDREQFALLMTWTCALMFVELEEQLKHLCSIKSKVLQSSLLQIFCSFNLRSILQKNLSQKKKWNCQYQVNLKPSVLFGLDKVS